MKKGFTLPILILGLLALGAFYVITFSTIYPNKKTQETAHGIPKYADVLYWDIKNDQTPCLFNFGNCQTPPSKISFSSEDPWASIYDAYKSNMGDFGWKTNSRVVTSIPTSIVFENEEGCSAELAENKSVFRQRNLESEENIFYYLFTIVCKN